MAKSKSLFRDWTWDVKSDHALIRQLCEHGAEVCANQVKEDLAKDPIIVVRWPDGPDPGEVDAVLLIGSEGIVELELSLTAMLDNYLDLLRPWPGNCRDEDLPSGFYMVRLLREMADKWEHKFTQQMMDQIRKEWSAPPETSERANGSQR